jgi:hypothetical protein
MTRLGRTLVLVVVASLATMALAIADPAGTPFPVALGKGTTLWLEGTSTMHDFESMTSNVDVKFTRDPQAAAPTDVPSFCDLITAGHVQSVTLKVAVKSLKSGKDGLDKNLYKTMHADEFPSIDWKLTSYTARPANGDTVAIEAKGTLTIVGKEKPVTLTARFVPTAAALALEGKYSLKMSDYGIKPPTMMLGALKVGDKITVRYKLQLIPGSETAAPVSTPKN